MRLRTADNNGVGRYPEQQAGNRNGGAKRLATMLALVLGVVTLLGVGWKSRGWLDTKADAEVVEAVKEDVADTRRDVREIKGSVNRLLKEHGLEE